MVVKVYISGISGNKEVKKRQQRVVMILESKNIPFEVIDITEPGKESEKDFMQTNSTSLGVTVSDLSPRHPLPPQIFTDSEYCGDYDQFDMANEIDTLEQFLKVEVPNVIENTSNGTTKSEPAKDSVSDKIEEVIEQIERNGIASSREASVEVEAKPSEPESTSNGAEEVDEAVDVEEPEDEKEEEEHKKEETKEEESEDEGNDEPEDGIVENEKVSKDSSPSEDLISSEKGAAD